MTDITAKLAEALKRHHEERTSYSRAKAKANATCGEFKDNPLSGLIESGYLASEFGKQTVEALALYAKHTEAQAGGTGGLPEMPEPRPIPGFYDISARQECRYTADQMRAYARAALAAAPAAAQGEPTNDVQFLARAIIGEFYTDEPSKETLTDCAWKILEEGRPAIVARARELHEKAAMPISDALDLAFSEASTPQAKAEMAKAEQAVPVAWLRGVMTPDTPMGAAEYDEECCPGEDRPNGDGWVPLYTAPPATERRPLWVPMHERAPAPDTDCVVYLRYSLDRPPFISTDRWEMQQEDPTGMGGPTMETGYGWRDNFESDVIAWMAVGELPPENWDQRLPTAGTTEQAKERDHE